MGFVTFLGNTFCATSVWWIYWKKLLLHWTSRFSLFEAWVLIDYGYTVCAFKSNVICLTDNFLSLWSLHLEELITCNIHRVFFHRKRTIQKNFISLPQNPVVSQKIEYSLLVYLSFLFVIMVVITTSHFSHFFLFI